MRTLSLIHPLWHAGGILLVLLLVSLQRAARRSGILAAALWNLAGVFLHETAHLLAGLLFHARPTGFSLTPRRHGRSWRLGSVTLGRVTAFNAVPVALAPLALFGVAAWLATSWFRWFTPSLSATLGLYGSLYVVCANALPSRQDLRVAFTWRSILLYGSCVAAIAGLLWHIRSHGLLPPLHWQFWR